MAEHGRRAAIDAFASFVLDSFSSAPLTEAKPKLHGGQTLVPVPVRTAAVSSPAHTEDRQECLSSMEMKIALPKPQPRIVVNLAPAPPAIDVARINRIVLCADAARARVEARMTLAEIRGRANGVRRIVVVVPDVVIPEAPPAPATL